MVTTRTHTQSYEYKYEHSTPMSTSEVLSTARYGDSRSHHLNLTSSRQAVPRVVCATLMGP